jgi:thiol:disulfide interchange protein
MRATVRPSLALGVCLLMMVPVFPKREHKPLPPPSSYKPVNVYDPARDPAKDIKDAIAEATQSKRRILLEVGGDWCIWCHIMDNLFEGHSKLAKLRDTHYVRVKVFYGEENANRDFLAQYPRILDYPHFFVLDSDGTFLHSQGTHSFEHGKTYNETKVSWFLRKWELGSWRRVSPDSPDAFDKPKR